MAMSAGATTTNNTSGIVVVIWEDMPPGEVGWVSDIGEPCVWSLAQWLGKPSSTLSSTQHCCLYSEDETNLTRFSISRACGPTRHAQTCTSHLKKSLNMYSVPTPC